MLIPSWGFLELVEIKPKWHICILWKRFVVLAILYPTEAMNISKDTIAELNRIQNVVARFILQLPKSVALAAAYVDGGMKPMDIRIQERTDMFVWKSMKSLDSLFLDSLSGNQKL